MRRVYLSIEHQDDGTVTVDVHSYVLEHDVSRPVATYKHTLAGRDVIGLRTVNDLLREIADGIAPLT